MAKDSTSKANQDTSGHCTSSLKFPSNRICGLLFIAFTLIVFLVGAPGVLATIITWVDRFSGLSNILKCVLSMYAKLDQWGLKMSPPVPLVGQIFWGVFIILSPVIWVYFWHTGRAIASTYELNERNLSVTTLWGKQVVIAWSDVTEVKIGYGLFLGLPIRAGHEWVGYIRAFNVAIHFQPNRRCQGLLLGEIVKEKVELAKQ